MGINQRLGFGSDDNWTRAGGLLAVAAFIGSIVLILMGLSEESYSINEGHDSTDMLCKFYNEPRNIHYIPTTADAVTRQICESNGCVYNTQHANNDKQCCLTAAASNTECDSTNICGLTANGYLHDGKHFNLGFSKIAGIEADFNACMAKSQFDYEFNQGYLGLTMAMVIVYFAYTAFHILMEPKNGYETNADGTTKFEILSNNTWVLFLTEFMSLFLLLPYFVASRAALPDAVYHENHKNLENNPSSLIFAGWILLVVWIATHATLQGKSLHGVFAQSIGAGSDNASGKSKAGKNRKVTSIHW